MSQPSGSVQKCSSDPAASQADLTADGCDLKKKKVQISSVPGHEEKKSPQNRGDTVLLIRIFT